jgi:hypothetical protein
MFFFVVQVVVTVLGLVAHTRLDRSAARRTTGRVLELAVLWLVVTNGAFLLLGGFGHTSAQAPEIAAGIGPDYIPSMFQWEVGWSDLALGLASVLVVRRGLRGGWLAAVVLIAFVNGWGDGIGHLTQWLVHDNTAPNNLLAMPTDFGVPLLAAVLLLLLARRRADAPLRPDTDRVAA